MLGVFKPKPMYRKHLKIPDSLDFLGFFTYTFLRLSCTYFDGYKIRILYPSMDGYENRYVIRKENTYFYVF